jgi:hypothetical protein
MADGMRRRREAKLQRRHGGPGDDDDGDDDDDSKDGSADAAEAADIQPSNVIKPVTGQQAAVTFGVGVSTQELNDALDKSGLFTLGAAHGVSSITLVCINRH